MPKNKRLRIMAGPNGSGKSTIFKAVKNKYYCGPFVNADEIERSFNERGLLNPLSEFDLKVSDDDFKEFINGQGKSWVDKSVMEGSPISIESRNGVLVTKEKSSAYDAAMAAEFIRYKLLEKEDTFTVETVMSHPSKIEFLQQSKALGYKNYLYFICTISPTINIDHVKQRFQLGGHDVPTEKIEKRYYESLQVLPAVIPLCHRVYLFDNSRENISLEPVAEIDDSNELVIHNNSIPWWVGTYVIDTLYN